MLGARPDIRCFLELHYSIGTANFVTVFHAVEFRAPQMLIVLQNLDPVAAEGLLYSLAVKKLGLCGTGLQGDGENGNWDDTGAHWA